MYPSVLQIYLLADPFWPQKITKDPHVLAHINIVCPDVRHLILKIFISELIVDT